MPSTCFRRSRCSSSHDIETTARRLTMLFRWWRHRREPWFEDIRRTAETLGRRKGNCAGPRRQDMVCAQRRCRPQMKTVPEATVATLDAWLGNDFVGICVSNATTRGSAALSHLHQDRMQARSETGKNLSFSTTCNEESLGLVYFRIVAHKVVDSCTRTGDVAPRNGGDAACLSSRERTELREAHVPSR